MHKDDYFIKALNEGAYKYRDWVLSCFSTTRFQIITDIKRPYHMQLVHHPEHDGLYAYQSDDPTNLLLVDGYVQNEPLMQYQDNIVLNTADLLNVTQETKTTYGNCLYNAAVIIYAFGDKIPFITGRIEGSDVESMVAKNLHDTPPEDAIRDSDKFYVDELLRHADAATALDAYSYTCVPTTSARTMVPNKAVIKRRDELLKIHKDELHKPAVIAAIQEELVELDKEYFNDDRASGFYISGKAYSVTRMKKFTMLGLIGAFGGTPPDLVTTSLAEGWQKESIPALYNDIRAGSYSRGVSTAIAGAGVKLIHNALQTVGLTEDDCGEAKGKSVLITTDNYKMFDGVYQITPTGLQVLDSDRLKPMIGKSINVRTPMLCKTKPPKFCKICGGDKLAMLPNAIHTTASNINSVYMNATMKSMHGKSLKTKRLDIFQNK